MGALFQSAFIIVEYFSEDWVPAYEKDRNTCEDNRGNNEEGKLNFVKSDRMNSVQETLTFDII